MSIKHPAYTTALNQPPSSPFAAFVYTCVSVTFFRGINTISMDESGRVKTEDLWSEVFSGPVHIFH